MELKLKSRLSRRHMFENRPLRTSVERRCAARILAISFADNPLNKYIFQEFSENPDRSEYFQAWTWVYEKRLEISGISECTTYGRFVDNELVSVLTIGSSSNQHPTYKQILRSGMWRWKWRFGGKSLKRFLEVGKEVIDMNENLFAGKVQTHLTMVATAVEHRGQGHAAELIRFALINQDGYVGLDTQCKENITLYKKLGFEIATSWEMLPKTSFKFVNYLMAAEFHQEFIESSSE